MLGRICASPLPEDPAQVNFRAGRQQGRPECSRAVACRRRVRLSCV